MPFPTCVFPSLGYRHLSLHGHLYSRPRAKCGDIIEQHTDIVTEQFCSMVHADVLYDFVLMVAKLVKIAIDF